MIHDTVVKCPTNKFLPNVVRSTVRTVQYSSLMRMNEVHVYTCSRCCTAHVQYVFYYHVQRQTTVRSCIVDRPPYRYRYRYCSLLYDVRWQQLHWRSTPSPRPSKPESIIQRRLVSSRAAIASSSSGHLKTYPP